VRYSTGMNGQQRSMSEDRRRVDSELDASFRTLFDAIDEGCALCDMLVDEQGVAVDYRFILVNPLFEEMTGLVDAAGKTALELLPNLERVWIDTYSRVAFGQETIRFEQGSDAMGRWFEVFAAPVPPHGRFAVVFKDQTARRRWEQSLRRSADNSAFVAELLSALDVHDTFAARVQHLTDSIVGRFADYATVEAPHRSNRLLSLSHVTDHGAEILRTLRTEHRLPEGDPASVYQATANPQLIRVVTPEMRSVHSTSLVTSILLEQLGSASHIAVPIELGAGEKGVLMVGTAGPDGRPFESDDVSARRWPALGFERRSTTSRSACRRRCYRIV
jgi:PAS domain